MVSFKLIGERDTYRGNTIENRGCLFVYWRASVASETLTGVTQSKIKDVYLFIYLFICIYYVWTYICHFVL